MSLVLRRVNLCFTQNFGIPVLCHLFLTTSQKCTRSPCWYYRSQEIKEVENVSELITRIFQLKIRLKLPGCLYRYSTACDSYVLAGSAHVDFRSRLSWSNMCVYKRVQLKYKLHCTGTRISASVSNLSSVKYYFATFILLCFYFRKDNGARILQCYYLCLFLLF